MKKKMGIAALVVVLAGALLTLWMANSGWLEDFNAEQNQVFQERIDAGTALGKTADQQQCLDQALQDFNGCLGYQCTVASGKYLKACLAQAKPSEGFCANVPEFRDKPTEDDKDWAKGYCRENNILGDNCRLLMRQQQLFCSQ